MSHLKHVLRASLMAVGVMTFVAFVVAGTSLPSARPSDDREVTAPAPGDARLTASDGEDVEVVLDDDRRLARSGSELLLDESPFDGIVVSRADDGSMRASVPYRAGRKHGTARAWYTNGQLESLRTYTLGEKVGSHRGYWPDGSPRFESGFDEGRNDGQHRSWYDSGQPYQSRNYGLGVEVGRQQTWTADGRLHANYVVKDGRRYGLIGSRLCSTVGGES